MNIAVGEFFTLFFHKNDDNFYTKNFFSHVFVFIFLILPKIILTFHTYSDIGKVTALHYLNSNTMIIILISYEYALQSFDLWTW
jgi:hypothetical protein